MKTPPGPPQDPSQDLARGRQGGLNRGFERGVGPTGGLRGAQELKHGLEEGKEGIVGDFGQGKQRETVCSKPASWNELFNLC